MTEQPDMDLPDGGKSYKLVAEGAESTVVAEYEPSHGRETAYQSEADLEEELLRILESQGYERLSAVVPEKLRTLDHGRPWSDDQFASTRLSSNRDMSR